MGHSVEYQFDWKGDGSDLSPWGSSTQSKTWTVPGTYAVQARARCATDTSVISGWSSALSVTIVIETVSTPSTPSGPTTGTIGKSCTYSTGGSISNVGHSVEYQFDWKGDGSDLSDWGPGTQTKIWTVAGIYNIRARARCSQDVSVVSEWCDSLSIGISVPHISATPATYDFGNVKVKRSKAASVKVTNGGTANLLMSTSIGTGTDASMFTIIIGRGSKTIKPGKALSIRVGFKPTSMGTKGSVLRIVSNDPQSPTLDVLLSGEGF